MNGTATATLAAIDAWLQREELLQVKRQMTDRMVWEPRRDLFGALRRALNVGGRGYALTRAPSDCSSSRTGGAVAPDSAMERPRSRSSRKIRRASYESASTVSSAVRSSILKR